MQKLWNLRDKYRWILVIVVLLGFSGKYFIWLSESEWFNIPILSKGHNIKECKNIILDQLSAPSTAVFTEIKYSNKLESTIIIKWSVDSQNALWGMIRSDFICNKSDWKEMDSLIKKDWVLSDEYDAIFKTRESLM